MSFKLMAGIAIFLETCARARAWEEGLYSSLKSGEEERVSTFVFARSLQRSPRRPLRAAGRGGPWGARARAGRAGYEGGGPSICLSIPLSNEPIIGASEAPGQALWYAARQSLASDSLPRL